MILLIAIYVFLMLTSHIKGYLHFSKRIDYKWNPLQFPNTKVYTIITFDDVGWNKIINQTNSDSNDDDNDYIDFIITMTRQCFYDAFGYTVSAMNPIITTTPKTITTTPKTITTPTQYPIRSNRRYRYKDSTSDSNRRLLNNDGNEDEYDKFFKNKIAFKNIKKSLLSGNRFNYTFGILFNDMIVFDEYMVISLDINHEYQLLRAVFYQCLSLTLNVKHIQLHVMSLSEGIYGEDSSDIDSSDDINKSEYNNTNLNGNNGDLIVDLDPTTTKTSIEYNVMITLNDNCLRNKGGMYVTDIIIDEIITFYSNCLRWKDNDNNGNLKYKTYHVSDIEKVYFFKIIDNDRSCLIDIDMQYLENKCVDNIEYEPVYKLDIINNGYSVQCDALNISNLNVWNLDFFDGLPNDNIYSLLETNNDHGVDIYILDTGILSSHIIFSHTNNLNLKYIHQSPNVHYIPSHYHGTYVAGIAGGDIYGISRNLTIYDYEVCEGSSCSYSKVLAGIDAAKNNMISKGRRGVINLSFGGPIAATNDIARQNWDYIMKGIIDAGGIPVCSAGNTQLDGCNYVPGQSQYCISVGAFDEFGNLYSRTNYGTCVDIFAPGVAIKSAGTSTNSQYITRSGTSAAAPHITGLISNLLYINPTLSFDHILYILNNNKQFLSSCPNQYTQQTNCPYISLPCIHFKHAIDDALASVKIPTEQPTNAPTYNPIKTPSLSPSYKPTKYPTKFPTNMPTISPTYKPTETPTTAPTDSPTLSSISPTISPTISPSNAPTNSPTNLPTPRHMGLGLHGFNNGFNVHIQVDNSSAQHINEKHKHNNAFCLLRTSNKMLLILYFSFVLSLHI